MNFDKAREILGLKVNFTKNELKKAYYKKALLYHPDRSHIPDAKEKFQILGDAYNYLQKYSNIEVEEIPWDYKELIKRCQYIFEDYKKYYLSLLKTIEIEQALDIYDFLQKYNDIFNISSEVLNKIRGILREKLQKNDMIVLNPSLKDIWEGNIYVLKIRNSVYYIPLWHHELLFSDGSQNNIIVRCIPEIENNITIDEKNHIYVKHAEKIENILNNPSILIFIGKKKFIIPTEKLTIKKMQHYTFKNQGILQINEKNIYDSTKRGDIIIYITLS